MQDVSFRKAVDRTFTEVRNFSFEEKKNLLSEEKINKLLDGILELKRFLTKKTASIDALVEKIENVTWHNVELDEEALLKVNDLISAIKDSHSTLVRFYVSLNMLRKKNIAREETQRFKAALDDYKDVAQDLESRFFFLPSLPGFTETTKQLSLV